MKKLLLLTLFACLNVGLISAQTDRKVFVEEFTNASCGPCASQNPAFNTLMEQNKAKVITLKYQTVFPGYDPMHNTNPTEVDTKWDYYVAKYPKITGVPVTLLDGYLPDENYAGGIGAWQPLPNGYAGGPYGYNQAAVDYATAIPSPVSIDVTHQLNATLDSILVHVEISNATFGPYSFDNLHLKLALAEEKITYSAAPGTNGEKEFFNVFRKAYPDLNGIAITETVPMGDSYVYEATFAIDHKWIIDFSQIYMVAYLQNDDDYSVIQAGRSEVQPFPAGFTGGDAGIANTSEGFTELCPADRSITPKFEITNESDNKVTKVEVALKVTGSSNVVKSFDVDLDKGETATLEFDPVAINNTSGILSFSILSINSGDLDYNGGNNNSTAISYQLLSATASTDKVEEGFEFVSTNTVDQGFEHSISQFAVSGLHAIVKGSYFGVTDKLGGYGLTDYGLWINFYQWAPSIGNNDGYIINDKVSFKNSKNTILTFDRAYAPYSEGGALFQGDAMAIDISTDCGESWTTVYEKHGDELTTGEPSEGTFFLPTPETWATDTVDLKAFDGQEEVVIRLHMISDWGNFLFLDNFNTSQLIRTKEVELNAKANIYPNPAVDNAVINIDATSSMKVNVGIYDILGKLVSTVASNYNLSQGFNQISVNTATLVSGSYVVKIAGESGVKTMPLQIIK